MQVLYSYTACMLTSIYCDAINYIEMCLCIHVCVASLVTTDPHMDLVHMTCAPDSILGPS